MWKLTTEQKMYFSLRLAVAFCFIGHGAFGIITKQVWCNYFAVFGIGNDLAYRLMPPLGAVDILFGVVMLIYPLRIIPLWLVIWGALTAMLRPLSGEHFAEFIERAGNFGAPLALLLLTGIHFKGVKSWFSPVRPEMQTDAAKLTSTVWCLRVVVFLLLAGHGWLNLIEKPGLLSQYTSIGFSNPQKFAQMAGWFEILGALAVLIRPVRSLLVVLFIWKMASELFYPRYEIFEWLERSGSYASILALLFATPPVSGLLSVNKGAGNKLVLKPS